MSNGLQFDEETARKVEALYLTVRKRNIRAGLDDLGKSRIE